MHVLKYLRLNEIDPAESRPAFCKNKGGGRHKSAAEFASGGANELIKSSCETDTKPG